MRNKNKTLLIIVMASVVLFIAHVAIVQAGKAGLFNDGYFVYPDYNNGDTETIFAGDNRTFNYACYCANQPGKSTCNGYARLQVDTGSGFVDERSDVCDINENQTCSGSHSKTFDTGGLYKFRVFCDENSGTDFTQSSSDYVTLTVQDTCTEGETRPCSLQLGVCEGFFETCLAEGIWPGCDYGLLPGYGTEESFGCDSLDNNCNGFVDDVDIDGDGSSVCGGMGVVNELLMTGLGGSRGQIDIFAYNPSASNYNSIWSTDTSGIVALKYGAEIGDITHDGLDDFVITRSNTTLGGGFTEVWTYNPVLAEWYMVWRGAWVDGYGGIGAIADLDNDGFTELLITDSAPDRIEVWGNDAYDVSSFNLEAVVRTCSDVRFIKTACDMDGDNTPEIVTQCVGDDIIVYEWDGASYAQTGALPFSDGSIIDHMTCGDVDRDSFDEVVFCGNSERTHVLEYLDGTYAVTFSSAAGPSLHSFTEQCEIGDVTNDGFNDFFSVSKDGVTVYSWNGNGYDTLWNSGNVWGGGTGVGRSHIGDVDNDGYVEFVTYNKSENFFRLWENDVVGATSWATTHTFADTSINSVPLIGNFNPYNDEGGMDCDDNDNSRYPGAVDVCGDGIDQDCSGADTVCNCVDGDLDSYYEYGQVFCQTGDDCDDSDYSVNPGAEEICGDSIDNNCNNEIDEGCGPVCGDGYCDGIDLGEDCRTCSVDCPSGSKGVCCGDNRCDSRKGETNSSCPVDCP